MMEEENFTLGRLQELAASENALTVMEGIERYLLTGESRGLEMNGPNAGPGEFWDIVWLIHKGYCQKTYPKGCGYFCDRQAVQLDDHYNALRELKEQ